MFLGPILFHHHSGFFLRDVGLSLKKSNRTTGKNGVVMAFTAQNDASQDGGREDKTSTHCQQNEGHDENGKVFVPNPEAKPFFPGLRLDIHIENRLTWSSETTSHDGVKHDEVIPSPDASRLIIGQSPGACQLNDMERVNCSFFHSSPSSESGTPQLLMQVSRNEPAEHALTNDIFSDIGQVKTGKEHIAYHLLAKVLDDEISEDSKHEETSDYGRELGCDVLESNDSWPASVSSISSSLSLTLDLGDQSMQHPTNFSNRSIHDIWSPNISPKGSSQSSPSEEGYSFFPADSGHESPFHCNGIDLIETGVNKGLHLSSPSSAPLSSAEKYLAQMLSPTEHQNGQSYSSSFPTTNNNYISSSPDSLVEKLSQRVSENGFYPASFNSQLSYFSEDRTSKTASDFEDLQDSLLSWEDNESVTRGKRHSVHFDDKLEELHNTKREDEDSGIKLLRDEGANAAKLLGLTLDECLDQLRSLEKECRKAEHELNKIYPSRRGSSSCGSFVSKLPSNPTRVDKMILEQSKEHSKVESLVGRIERLGSSPLHPNVGISLDEWWACIKELQSIRREELNNSNGSTNGHYPKKSYSDKDLFSLAKCIKNLITHTRAARTTVWCAVQMLHADFDLFKIADSSCSAGDHANMVIARS